MSEFWTGPESILRGYLARQELNQRQQQLDQERQNAQDLVALHQKQIDQSAKQFGEQMKFRQMLVKNAMQEHLNELYGDNLSAPASAITGIGSQTDLSQEPNETQDQSGNIGILPGIQHNMQFQAKPWQMNIPGMEDLGPVTIDPDYQSKLARIGLNQAKTAAYQKGLEKAATFPFDEKLANEAAGSKFALKQADIEGRLKGIESTYGYKTNIEAAHDEKAIRVAEIQALAKELTAQGKQADPQEISDFYDNVTNGTLDYDRIPAKYKPGISTLLRQHGEKLFGTKQNDDLAGISVLDNTFENLRDLANNYFASEKDYGGRAMTYLKSLSPFSELTNKINQIEQQAPNLVRNLAGVKNGRITNLELTKMLHGMVSGKLSREMLLDNIDNLQRLATGRILDYQLGSMPLAQQSRILNKFPNYYNRYKVPIMDRQGNIGEVYAEDYNKDIESGEYLPVPRK